MTKACWGRARALESCVATSKSKEEAWPGSLGAASQEHKGDQRTVVPVARGQAEVKGECPAGSRAQSRNCSISA